MNRKSVFLILFILFSFYYCDLFEDDNPYSGITETVIDSVNWCGTPMVTIISEDPDDWNINYNPPFPDTLLLPEIYKIGPAFPNPAIDSTYIELATPNKTLFNIFIKDRDGHIVKIICSDSLDPGYYRLYWNLNNNEGKKVSSDIYRCFYNFEREMYKDSSYTTRSSSGYGDIKVK